MVVEDGYGEENLMTDLENKKNQKIDFNNILYIGAKEKVWGSVLFLDVIEDGKEKKLQFSVVQDWVKYPISAPMKYLKVDWSRFVKYIQDKQIVTK
jgi:translation initiation factor IF-3